MSSCSRISAQALLQSVQDMVQSLSELHDLRRRVREAEASFARAKRLRHGLSDGVEKHFEAKPVPLPMLIGDEKKVMAKKLPSRSALNVIEPPLGMRPRSLLELNETDCHWPLGEVHEVAVLFCGASKEPVFPYCGHHLRMAQG